MSVVNTDSESLLTALQNMRIAISSIESTKRTLSQKYQQLGQGWSDRKYAELGDIVQESNKALNNILGILKKGETYVAQLAKNIQEYEDVNMGEGRDGSFFTNLFASRHESQVVKNSANNASTATPRALMQTQYGFEPMSVNGQTMMMYNKPYETARTLIVNQGGNSRNMQGTCGLCQCVNVLRMAGVNTTEDEVINVALSCGGSVRECLEMENPAPEERGGTSSGGRQVILDRFNLYTYQYPISETNREASVSHLAEAVRTGHGVIISADAGVLWNDSRYLGGGHAVSLLSVSEDGGTFIYSDTGTGTIGTISSYDLSNALTGRPANITESIIR